MMTILSVLPLFVITSSTQNRFVDAWGSSLSYVDIITPRKGRNRCKTRSSWEYPLSASRGQNKIYGSMRDCNAKCLLLYVNSNDEDELYLEEEEFYSEYESMYSQNEEAVENDENSDRNKQQDDISRRPTNQQDKKKVEVAKAWDEVLADNNNDMISSLTDLQQKLDELEENYDGNVRQPTEQKEIAEVPENSDPYSSILKKAKERYSETSSYDDSSNTKNRSSQTKISNISSLSKRLNELQLDVSAKTKADADSSSSEPLQQPLEAKYLDDETLEEWEALNKQLETDAAANTSKKKVPLSSILERGNEEVSLADEEMILDALRSQAAAADDDLDIIDNPDSSTPNDIPNNKDFVSGYKITDDGGVFLSPKAYEEACDNVNPDGSLNLRRGDVVSDSTSQQKFSTVESTLVDDEPPMAPYSDEKGDGGKEVSIKDLTERARQSLDFAKKNPEAQEELHRRLIAELEAEEPAYDEFENEALLDPEKAASFWNQEYHEKQKEKADALEDLLDQKMREFKNLSSTKGQSARELETQKQEHNIFFAPREERIDRKRLMERNRRQRAKNIAEFYEVIGTESSWDSCLSSEAGELTSEQETPPDDQKSTTRIEETQEDQNLVLETEEVQDRTPINDRLPDTNEIRKNNSNWVFVEDPESPNDAFYWNEVTNEMRWDPPEESEES